MFDIFEQVKNANTIAISGHVRPDGDCIGSCLGLYLYLKKRMPEARIKVYLEEPDASFKSIPSIGEIDSTFAPADDYDVFILLDTVPERLGDAQPFFDSAKKKINIDHHISNIDGAGDVNYIDPKAAATGMLVYNVIDKAYMDADIAALLYMAIAHDTGVFRFSNTSPDTLRVVADLLEFKFDFSKLLDQTFFEKTYLQNCTQGRIVLDSKLYYDGLVIVGCADASFMKQYGVTKNDFDGVVNQLMLTQNVEAAVFAYEKTPGCFKFSLRSCSDLVNVSQVCQQFGGGGHIRAAGFDFMGTFEEGIEKVLEAIGKQINV